ncbi:MAG TPA: hypothetical protein VNZ03_31380 [Terriglobales bacterium]|jgi:hypothetical protein|nr:hypothetical protein [Terriglobales bacterium]
MAVPIGLTNETALEQCLFCSNLVNSAEHIWSDWILEDLKLVTQIRIKIGKNPPAFTDDPELKVKCVCETCNSQWMSNLETANQPIIHAMINDDPCWLSKKDQTKLTRWAMLKAMVIEAANRERKPFYDDQERQQIKTGSGIPIGTMVWLGRFSTKSYHAGGTDIWRPVDEIPKAIHACVTTVIIGHLVLQILTAHTRQQFATRRENLYCKDGPWKVNLLEIWPLKEPLRWPPALSFAERGTDSIATIINRWKLGENIG